jgi:DMSO reductase family type II enzyme chaperone
MSSEMLSGLQGEAERRAAARSVGYRLFSEALDYPDELLLEEIREGRLARALEELLQGLGRELAAAVDWDALRDAGVEDELQIEYTRLFDVGAAGPPCPLYGGLYGGARMKTMEEAVRFYNHFGLTLSETLRELPDHLRTELEFLHYLAFREAQALQRGADPGPYRRAQRDFLERHPARWVPKLRGRLAKQKPMRFFSELVVGLERFLDGARAELTELTREGNRRNGQVNAT